MFHVWETNRQVCKYNEIANYKMNRKMLFLTKFFIYSFLQLIYAAHFLNSYFHIIFTRTSKFPELMSLFHLTYEQ